MAINWRGEADNIINTDDIFDSLDDILNPDDDIEATLEENPSGKQKLGKYGFVSYEFQTYCNYEQDERSKYGYRYRVSPVFRFEPIKDRLNASASEIAFIQIVKAVNKIPPKRYNENENTYITKKVIELVQQNSAYMERLTDYEHPIDKYWFLDRVCNIDHDIVPGYPDYTERYKSPWYGYDNNGIPMPDKVIPGYCQANRLKLAIMNDRAGYFAEPTNQGYIHVNEEWLFQTYIIAKEGKDKGQIYGAVVWGFDVKGTSSKVTVKLHSVQVKTSWSRAFQEAVCKWNEQAIGDQFVPKNHKDQEVVNLNFSGVR